MWYSASSTSTSTSTLFNLYLCFFYYKFLRLCELTDCWLLQYIPYSCRSLQYCRTYWSFLHTMNLPAFCLKISLIITSLSTAQIVAETTPHLITASWRWGKCVGGGRVCEEGGSVCNYIINDGIPPVDLLSLCRISMEGFLDLCEYK